MESDPIVIVSSARTPLGSFQGMFASLKAPELGANVIKAVVDRAGLDTESIDQVIMGCVISGGVGQAPARQAALLAGLSQATNCMTINKVCGSGMKAVMLGYDSLLLNDSKIIVAGGMESMTNAPYILDRARSGYRIGHGQCKDLMFVDGLEDAYSGKLMGIFAEQTVDKYKFSREEQDNFALASLDRAIKARNDGYLETNIEINPVTVKAKKGEAVIVTQDDEPSKANANKIKSLKPAFKDNGTVTAANSSSIADGAAALILMRRSEAKKRNLKPLATILGHTSFSREPEWFTIAPVGAMQALLKKLDWTSSTPDLYEINEAFAVVAMAAINDLNLDHTKVNIYGGACAIGHPLGATGARIICTLLNALVNQDKTLGVASLCIGGGEAVAIAIERCR